MEYPIISRSSNEKPNWQPGCLVSFGLCLYSVYSKSFLFLKPSDSLWLGGQHPRGRKKAFVP